ncbi:hypothetical protein GCM10012287_12660 [Streptomyces daqingensis]|uniref:HTH merR-type domain-containing protein n=1 Tax=Streptomyces daqingensis TaxID=1472640 RepID=A0ABQ2M025_9ACTN|nr:hypothetical protein GCM10012287_12660 [Streptomyces daqingensis]
MRALHRYDEVGLLGASERTGPGHRRYTERDLRRLCSVRALRSLALSLEEIAGVLGGDGDDLSAMRDLLGAQLRAVRSQAARLVELEQQLGHLLRQLDEDAMPGPDLFMTTLEMISVYETSFTEEQRDQPAARRAELGR